MSTKRNTKSVKRFLRKALRGTGNQGPHLGLGVVCTDKSPTNAATISILKKDKKFPKTVQHRQVKYLNKVIEGIHGRLKRILGPKGGGIKSM